MNNEIFGTIDENLVQKIREQQRNATTGYRFRETIVLATDLVIKYYDKKGELYIALITRKGWPYGLAVPGGKQEPYLTMKDNMVKEGVEEIGIEFNPSDLTELSIYDAVDRDPRGRVLTKGYGIEIEESMLDKLCAGDDAADVKLYPYSQIKRYASSGIFAFPDHVDMIDEYVKKETDKKIEAALKH